MPKRIEISHESEKTKIPEREALPPVLELDAADISALPQNINEKSEELYFIERVIEFNPRRGYLCHWRGYLESERTWQRYNDMPHELRPLMKELRERFYAGNLVSVDAPPKEINEGANEAFKKQKLVHVHDPGVKSSKLEMVLGYDPYKGYEVKVVGQEGTEWVRARDIPRNLSAQAREIRRSVQKSPHAIQKFEISGVIDFDPEKGFLVSWKGYSSEFNSWQKEYDMPSAFADDMESLRRAFSSAEHRVEIETPSLETTKESGNMSINHVLHSVIKFDPRKGFFVHWKGLPEFMDSWIPESEIGEGYRYQAQLARERYFDNVNFRE